MVAAALGMRMVRDGSRHGVAGLGLALAALGAAPDRATADPLLGDAAAVHSTPEAADANPANAAFVDRTQIMVNPVLFKQESLQVRYPGFEPISQSDNGLAGVLGLGKPAFIFKLSPRFGLGGYVVPPIGLGADIRKERIPVVILDTLNYVDLVGSGTLNGAGQLTVGFKATDTFGFGLKAAFSSLKFGVSLIPSEGGDPLATIDGERTEMNVTAGLRFDIVPGRFALGAAFGLFSAAKNRLDVESPLMQASGGAGDAAGGQGGAAGTVTNPLDSILVGMQAAIAGGRVRLLADAKYTRVNKQERAFSLVDLQEKPKDVHDTLGVRSGLILNVKPGANALVGFRYEPASLGAGAPGEDGSVGFGTMELVQIFAGMGDLTPYWQAALGLQVGFSPKVDRIDDDSEGEDREGRGTRKRARGKGRGAGAKKAQGYYQWTVSLGVAHKRASLGIDENGELPGAYLYKKTYLPLTVIYKF